MPITNLPKRGTIGDPKTIKSIPLKSPPIHLLPKEAQAQWQDWWQETERVLRIQFELLFDRTKGL